MAAIYVLTDPRTDEIRYVGQTMHPLKTRLEGHLNDCSRENHHCANWLKSLLRENLQPIIALLEECSIEELDDREIYWIAYGRQQGWRLTNATEGGGGTRGWGHSEAAKQKNAESHKGRTHSEAAKQKMSESRKGYRNHFYGKTHLPVTKRKMIEAKKDKHIGEKNPNAKLTIDNVLEIRELLNSTMSIRRIAEQFGVSPSAIKGIKSGKTWSGLKGDES